MHKEKFDIAFQLHGGGGNSNPFVKKLTAKLSVGLQAPDAPPLDINISYQLLQNEVLRYLEVVSKVGASTANLSPYIEAIPSDFEELDETIEIKGPFAVIHPGASSVHRRWPADKFAMVSDFLAENGYKIY